MYGVNEKSRIGEGEREWVKVKVSKGMRNEDSSKRASEWMDEWLSDCMSERVSDELAMRWHCVEMQMKQD